MGDGLMLHLSRLSPSVWERTLMLVESAALTPRDRVTPRTTLRELQARVRQDSRDRSSQLLRSIQGSLRVEGYVVSEAVLRSELAKLHRA